MTDYIESGQIYESTDKRRPPRRIRVEDIEEWWDAEYGSRYYARCTEKRFQRVPNHTGYHQTVSHAWDSKWSGETHILIDHLNSRHNWKRIK